MTIFFFIFVTAQLIFLENTFKVQTGTQRPGLECPAKIIDKPPEDGQVILGFIPRAVKKRNF